MKINNYKLFYFLQAMLKYMPFRLGIWLRYKMYKPFFGKLGKGVVIQDNVSFKFPSDIFLDDNVKIAQQCIFVGASGLKIGKNVLIGAGCKIITSSHIHKDINKPISEQGLEYSSVNIGDDVWFGFNVVVLKGCSIGKGVIIGANSVVTHNIADYLIVGGVPAKIIKNRKESNEIPVI